MTKQEENKIKSIIKSEVEKQFKDLEDSLTKKHQKDLKDLEKNILTKEDIKKLIVKAFIQQNKFMWEKSSIVTQFINKI
jgi:hypothetical protein